MDHKLLKNRIFALTLVLALLCGIMTAAEAAGPPDLTRRGSISAALGEGSELTLYRAGRPVVEDGDHAWALTPEFAGSHCDLGDLDAEKLPATLLAWAQRQKLSGITVRADREGVIRFEELEAGLYLLCQQKASAGYELVSPFLVTLPGKEDGEWDWQVDARPKLELLRKPGTTPPPKPGGPKLPQTSQLNWPVPVLAFCGLVLFGGGWMLYYSGKGRGER